MEYSLDLLQSRHSVRNYLPESVPDSVRNFLRAEITMINSHEAGLNFQLFFDDDNPFRGFSRSYGMFHNPRNYLAAVIDPTFADAEERAGYFAEQFVMKLTEMGLGSCFISGSYSAKNVSARMEVYERLPFVVLFGLPAEREKGFGKLMSRLVHGKEMSPREFFDGDNALYQQAVKLYPWIETGLAGIACAPSASNRRPVRVSMEEREGEQRIVAFTPKGNVPIDLGIAKYNFQASLSVSGIWEWGEKGAFLTDD